VEREEGRWKDFNNAPHPCLRPRGGKGRKDFNSTPHFGSLPQGERRIERMERF